MSATYGKLAAGRMVAGLALVVAAGHAGAQSSQAVRPVVASAPAQAGLQAESPQAAINPPQAVPLEPAGNTLLAELRQLVEQRAVRELRTTYNGQYGASLLFQADALQYFVALFQDRSFWRVIKTDSIEEAEQLYTTFVEQTRELAQVHIDTVRSDAGKRYTERMVSLHSQRLQTLQQEVDQQREQSMQVSAALQQARQQAVTLSTDLRATNSQLDAINQRIRALQDQQSSPETLIPPPATPPPAPAPAPSAERTGDADPQR